MIEETFPIPEIWVPLAEACSTKVRALREFSINEHISCFFWQELLLLGSWWCADYKIMPPTTVLPLISSWQIPRESEVGRKSRQGRMRDDESRGFVTSMLYWLPAFCIILSLIHSCQLPSWSGQTRDYILRQHPKSRSFLYSTILHTSAQTPEYFTPPDTRPWWARQPSVGGMRSLCSNA